MPAVTVEELEPEPEPEPEPEAEKQVMEIDFAALAEATEDQTLAEMYRYFAKVTPSTQNEYTGYFAGEESHLPYLRKPVEICHRSKPDAQSLQAVERGAFSSPISIIPFGAFPRWTANM